jgi:phosphatidylinositol-3,4,5-trisphosphate 3-phosphatase and dual-specificity protein phosphatase PTEN
MSNSLEMSMSHEIQAAYRHPSLAALDAWDDIPALDPITQDLWPDEDDDYVPSTEGFVLAARKELETAAGKRLAASAAVATTTAAPQQSQVLAKMRSLVSQEKVRFQYDGFDLDLTYITPHIIAMGFPSSGKEAYYRNPIEEVERFFNTRHEGHYRIYNLCSEREYDAPMRFHGCYKRFPFDDHNAPCPVKLIPEFVRDAQEFLREHVDNVVAIHCKAGKGRTGVMIACLLRALEPNKYKHADAALEYFGNVRTADGKGVTIPSQKRYVRYWDLMQQYFQGREAPLRKTNLLSVKVESTIKLSGPIDVYFTIEENNKERIDSRRIFPAGGKRDEGGHLVFTFRDPFPTLSGDLRFIFYQRNSLLSDEELFHFWINTALCQATERLTKADGALDGRVAKSKDVAFAPTLAVEVHMGNTWVRPSVSSSAANTQPSSMVLRAGSNEPNNASDGVDDATSPDKSEKRAKERGYFKKLFGGEVAASAL